MRAFRVPSGLVLCSMYACSSTATTEPGSDGGRGGNNAGGSGATAGVPATFGGAASGTGGARTQNGAGASGEGGDAPSDGGDGNGSGGGPIGGTGNGDGGTGGSAECYDDDDCVNPHRATCTATCNEGVCELAPAPSLDMPIQSGPKDAAPRAGVWDSQGNAFLVFPSIGTEPLSINFQALDADGALQGTLKDYDLPPTMAVVDMVAAAVRGEDVGLLWNGSLHGDEMLPGGRVTQFAVTDFSGAPSTPMLLKERPANDAYPDIPYVLQLRPLGPTRWATLTYIGSAPFWRGYVAEEGMFPTSPPLDTLTLVDSPWALAPRTSVPPIPQAAVVVEDTLFVTGFDCEWFVGSTCEPNLVFARYDAETFEPLGQGFTALSTTSYPMIDRKQQPPALAKLGTRLAALWTQYSTTGELLMGRALFEKSGKIATMRSVRASSLIPKAVTESPGGGALLIASEVGGTEENPTYRLVAQRLDSNLGFLGEPQPLGPVSDEDAKEVVLYPGPDGLVLLTFRQAFAQHRILHADLCQ